MKRLACAACILSSFAVTVAHAQTATDRTSVAIVVHISTPSLLAPDGSPAPDRDRRLQALATDLDALAAVKTPVSAIALAPSAVMCDEIMRLKGVAPKHFLRSLRILAARSTVLAAPFSNVRLVDLPRDALAREIARGKSVIGRCVARGLSTSLYPPGLLLDDASVRAVASLGVRAAPVTGIDEPVRSDITLLPAVVATGEDTAATLLARRPSSRFVAATDLSASTAGTVRSLMTSAFVVVPTFEQAASSGQRLDFSLPSPPPPPVSYRRALLHADESFARFQAFTLRDNPLTPAYRDLLARARSSADMSGDFSAGRKLADGIVRLVASAARRVSVRPGSITFTSRRGSVPVTVINHDPFPVRVSVAASSPKLDFPGGQTRTVTVQPPGDTITFVAVARSSGSFPMLVSLHAADGSFVLDRSELTVRSTAANLPALAVTVGGFVLLIVFYLRRKKRRTA